MRFYQSQPNVGGSVTIHEAQPPARDVRNGCSFNALRNGEIQIALCSSHAGYEFNGCYVADGLSKSGPGIFSSRYSMVGALAELAGHRVPHGALIQSAADPGKLYVNSSAAKRIALGSRAAVTVAGATASFSASDASVIRVGDIVYAAAGVPYRGPLGGVAGRGRAAVGVVSDISGSRITLSGIPESFTTGTYDLEISYFARVHVATTGDLNGDALITNVTQPGLWTVGTRIWGAGIPPGAYITDIAGSTFTISKPATVTATQVRLYDADIYVLAGAAL